MEVWWIRAPASHATYPRLIYLYFYQQLFTIFLHSLAHSFPSRLRVDWSDDRCELLLRYIKSHLRQRVSGVERKVRVAVLPSAAPHRFSNAASAAATFCANLMDVWRGRVCESNDISYWKIIFCHPPRCFSHFAWNSQTRSIQVAAQNEAFKVNRRLLRKCVESLLWEIFH